jgi:hypothetical protein
MTGDVDKSTSRTWGGSRAGTGGPAMAGLVKWPSHLSHLTSRSLDVLTAGAPGVIFEAAAE